MNENLHGGVVKRRNASLFKKGFIANFFGKSLIKNRYGGVINRRNDCGDFISG
ncbi:MAG: hypothetical protein ACOX7X_09275 [Methanosarcina flavescens]|uniref:hypothetical protein n=1 Tax=Methanosarcina flavescens TaxID=1715806 RepID=UPI0014355919|nr:hypothetical protein [Methanosarcina flavescens]